MKPAAAPLRNRAGLFRQTEPPLDVGQNDGVTDPLVVPPKARVQMRRDVTVDKGQVAKMGNCSLYKGYPAARDTFYSIFADSDENFDKRIHWLEINPTNWLNVSLERPNPAKNARPVSIDACLSAFHPHLLDMV